MCKTIFLIAVTAVWIQAGPDKTLTYTYMYMYIRRKKVIFHFPAKIIEIIHMETCQDSLPIVVNNNNNEGSVLCCRPKCFWANHCAPEFKKHKWERNKQNSVWINGWMINYNLQNLAGLGGGGVINSMCGLFSNKLQQFLTRWCLLTGVFSIMAEVFARMMDVWLFDWSWFLVVLVIWTAVASKWPRSEIMMCSMSKVCMCVVFCKKCEYMWLCKSGLMSGGNF